MTTNGSPFLLGPLGAMLPVDAEPGVAITQERGRGVTVSGGGVRRVQRGRYAPRTWDVQFDQQTPGATTLLGLAAQGLLGDVWLLDRAAAQQNMLHLHQVASSDPTAQRLNCAGARLRSVTPGPAYTVSVDVRATADAYVWSTNPMTNYGSASPLVAFGTSMYAFLRFPVPLAPAGGVLTSATLRMVAAGPSTQTATVNRVTSAWAESRITYATMPSAAGATLGTLSARVTDAVTTAALALTSADLGTDLSVAINQASTSQTTSLYSREKLGKEPVLRLVFTVTPVDAGWRQRVPVRGGQAYTFAGYVDNVAGGGTATWATDNGQNGLVNMPSVSGSDPALRWSTTFTPTVDTIVTLTMNAPTRLVSGLQLVEGSSAPDFYAGRGTPCRVSVADPNLTLARWRQGEQGVGDYTVQIVEVGVPGEVPSA